MDRETASVLADGIIIGAAFTYLCNALLVFISGGVRAVSKWHKRQQRAKLHERWVAARVAAREATEAKLRAEGRWDNYEIQDAMNAAGDAVAPGFRV